jgi:transcriptional regulator with XRE-family HTH domain
MKYSFMTTELRHTLAENLRALMNKRLDLDTQAKVHAATGLTQSSIGRVLAAKVDVTLDTLQRLSEVFRTTPAKLITQPEVAQQSAKPVPSELSLTLVDLFESLPSDPSMRAQAFVACQVALSVIEQQHAQKMLVPKPAAKPKKARG